MGIQHQKQHVKQHVKHWFFATVVAGAGKGNFQLPDTAAVSPFFVSLFAAVSPFFNWAELWLKVRVWHFKHDNAMLKNVIKGS